MLLQKGKVQRGLGLNAEALSTYQEIIANDTTNVNLLYYLGRSCANTSWKKQGIEYLKNAIDLTIPKDSTMTRLYIGMTDCYKMAQMPKEQIESIHERYRKYDRQNHKLLYDMAFVYFYSLKNKKKHRTLPRSILKNPSQRRKSRRTDSTK